MRDDVMQAAMATWAAKDVPARLNVAQTAKVLGFADHDIQVLMAAGRLEALGDPAPNSPKWFAAIEVIQLATDREWLHRATREVAKHWRSKRERRRTSASPSRSAAWLPKRPKMRCMPGPILNPERDSPTVAV